MDYFNDRIYGVAKKKYLEQFFRKEIDSIIVYPMESTEMISKHSGDILILTSFNEDSYIMQPHTTTDTKTECLILYYK